MAEVADGKILFDLLAEKKWFRTVGEAKRLLTPSQYEDWRFIVGLHGSPDVRAEVGEAALKEFFAPAHGGEPDGENTD